jgi:cell shape-determining protein MreC
MFFIRFIIIILLIVVLSGNNIAFLKSNIFSFLNQEDPLSNLRLENDSLKIKLYISENLSSKQTEGKGWEYSSGKVFSSYPFNNKNLVAINLGLVNGVKENSPVVVAQGILLGLVIEVRNNTSLIRTIFDKDLNVSVRIGDNKVNALLKGGVPPMLEMIDKYEEIKNGDIVYNADTKFPYGFKLGEIQTIKNKNVADSFQKAILKTDYDSSLLEEVLIINNFSSIE